MEKLINSKEKYLKYFMCTVLGFVIIGVFFDIFMVTLTLTHNDKMLDDVTKFIGKFI